jgi:hypothetical protein
VCRDEFTRFIVEKAQLYHASLSIDQIPEYSLGLSSSGVGSVEVASHTRAARAIDALCFIPRSQQLAVIQEHNPCVTVYNARTWRPVATLGGGGMPIAMCCKLSTLKLDAVVYLLCKLQCF